MVNPLMLLPVVALVGLAIASGKKGKSAAAGGKKPPAPGDGKYDSPGGPVMPLVVEQTVDKELAGDNNPAALRKFAASLSPSWPLAVAALNARADALEAAQAAGASPPPSPAHPTSPPAVPLPPPPPVPPPPAIPPVAGPMPSPIAIPPIQPVQPVSGDIGGGVYVTPGAPVVTQDPGGGTVTTLPPIVITGTPGGSVAPWDASMAFDPSSLPAVPGHYASAAETTSVQNALNTWAQESGYPGDEVTASGAQFPLTVDGDYGPGTQAMAAAFQSYQNATAQSGLTLDGLAGHATQAFLGVYGNLVPGSY